MTFLLEIDGTAVAAFRAEDKEEAWDYVNQAWFQADLQTFERDGRPLWDRQSKVEISTAPQWLRRRWEASAKKAVREDDCDEPDDWVLFLVNADNFDDEEEAA